ncbi:MAG: TonB-dependent receptor [Methylococcaceae bacterium]|nr:TonB-dependent receptor [Methylococcaceae bacterium]
MVILNSYMAQLRNICWQGGRVIAVLIILLLGVTRQVQAEDALSPSYQWGQGYHIPAYHLTLGGYTKVAYSYFEHAPQQAGLEDLSLFISWNPLSRLQFFSELELEDLFTLYEVSTFADAFKVERLYADLLINDEFKLRFGKILTPFSRWNLLHAAPLVWTSSRPMVTSGYVVSQHSTGLSANYNSLLFNRDFSVTLFADDSADLELTPDEHAFNYAFGGRLNYQLSQDLNIGSSFVAAQIEPENDADWQHTLGIDFLWQKNQFEIQMESFLNLNSSHNTENKYGLYVQGVAPLFEHFFAVGRYEYMYGDENNHIVVEEHRQAASIHVGVIGLVWRPAPPLALKVEYRFGQNNQFNAPSGVLTSIAMFF